MTKHGYPVIAAHNKCDCEPCMIAGYRYWEARQFAMELRSDSYAQPGAWEVNLAWITRGSVAVLATAAVLFLVAFFEGWPA